MRGEYSRGGHDHEGGEDDQELLRVHDDALHEHGLHADEAREGIRLAPVGDHHRVAEDDAHPEDVVSWEQVKAQALARLKL